LQVEFGARTTDEVFEPGGFQFTPDGAADQAAMAGDIDAFVAINSHTTA
jgi:hypothetical protein